ncbi:hypothetical protein DUPY_20960 [Duganella phyllosphaerae]|uniref:Uncharacterized protein n=1 Tax=Duganella phyllosphaerae TaxID=762836 RepID=A0A1E7WQV3_9BURK|nr:hypothetical protein DUPY_20960 [Duganella phyllosphaerae]
MPCRPYTSAIWYGVARSPLPPLTRKKLPRSILKLLAENAGRLALFCTQLPPSSTKAPPTLTMPLALMAEFCAPLNAAIVRFLGTARAPLRLISPPVRSSSTSRLLEVPRSSAPCRFSAPAYSWRPIVSVGALTVFSSVSLKPRLSALSAPALPMSMLPPLLRRCRLTVPVPVPALIDCAAPPRLILSATRLTVAPAAKPPPLATVIPTPAVTCSALSAWSMVSLLAEVKEPPVSRFRFLMPSVCCWWARLSGALMVILPEPASPILTVWTATLLSSSAVRPSTPNGLLPRSISRPGTSGLMVSVAKPAAPPKLRPPLKLIISPCKSTACPALPLPVNWSPLPLNRMEPPARLLFKLRLPLPTTTAPMPMMFAPASVTSPPAVSIAPVRLMLPLAPYAKPPVASLADRITAPPWVVMGALTLIASPAVAVMPMSALTMSMAALKLIRCVACNVTLLLALEIVVAPMMAVPNNGASSNWSTLPNSPLAPCTTVISKGSSSQLPPLPRRELVSTRMPSTAR